MRFQNYPHLDNNTRRTADTPGFKSFTMLLMNTIYWRTDAWNFFLFLYHVKKVNSMFWCIYLVTARSEKISKCGKTISDTLAKQSFESCRGISIKFYFLSKTLKTNFSLSCFAAITNGLSYWSSKVERAMFSVFFIIMHVSAVFKTTYSL